MTRHAANHITAQDTTHATVLVAAMPFLGRGAQECIPERQPACSAARSLERLTAGGWATLQVGCIRDDTWDPGRASSRLTATTHKVPHVGDIFTAHCSLLVRGLCTQRQMAVNRLLGKAGPKKARDPETWAVGCSLVADADALTRQLGEGLASIFPTHPDAPASMLRGDAVFDRLHVCYNRVNGQDGLCFGQPVSSPPCTNPLTEHCGH
ncbi:hypothetical protein F5883DRAFT_576263 [Diaporthe sp. PMI_573]|nr:hypothetical protein F5883DRAFT_576263 [Diaporthaceae sp. PMI_573]